MAVKCFLRTTYGNPTHEYGKYSMLFFTLLGLYYDKNNKNPFKIYLLLFIPAIFISYLSLNYDFRKKILFEILGPICLGTLALYTYKKEVSSKMISIILNIIALPLLSSCIFLILKFSFYSGFLDTNRSSFYYSGGYAPNQMATILGLGMFVYFFKIVLDNYSKKLLLINLIIFCIIFYRGLLTFSRGGILTGFAAILTLILTLYLSQNLNQFLKKKIMVSLLLLFIIFVLTSFQTQGKIFSRYIDTVKKESIAKGGRFHQLKYDILFFVENPVLGI